ncbi:hypothetical protein DACRYDRAFT_113580 [Dacryopinax primogenitus]|uniref:G-patch domain-containing protein n=1 Tax=Dacryopinax primogenitus (strain DJM 731) TaxID=1858805 RepID=M5GAS4_DACPD|nr:uncharacterized protein DACRYDRAFT_113580 [Dacryopinax primogenitus]EJU05475.1 hypothetical protein DACRYDRAFT_113580 [Dacryopinax primogenitus]
MSGGLYGGINFSAPSAIASSGIATPTLSTSTDHPASATTVVAAPSTDELIPENGKDYGQETNNPGMSARMERSAALAFAPVRRQANKPKPAVSKPLAARLPNLGVPASTTIAPFPGPGVSSTATISATAVVFAPPTVSEPPPEAAEGWTKKIKPPSMVLDEDVNGFRGGRGGGGGGGRHKKKRKNKQQNVNVWDPTEMYDPTRPNDYLEYKAYREREKEEAAMRRYERKRSWHSSEDEEGSGSDGENRWRPQKAGRFEPRVRDEYDDDEPARPRGLGAPSFAPSSSKVSGDAPSFVSTAPVQIAKDMTGDEAYQRRLAMSRGPAVAAVPSPVPSPSPRPPSPAPRPIMAETGEEAYQRRLAMSRGAAPRPPSPPLPASAPEPPQFVRPPPEPEDAEYSWAAPPAFPPTLPVAPPPTSSTPPMAMDPAVEKRRQAAAAIAAKLAALAPGGPTSVFQAPKPASPAPEENAGTPPEEADSHNFAARMMAKWGHKEGQGLGVSGAGIVHALSVEKVGGAKKGKPEQGRSGMGKIINVNEDVKLKEEVERWGEHSQVICLRNMVGKEDVDADLQGEIAEECSKHGVVERVYIHVAPRRSAPEDEVRIFVKFSGPVGAWKSVRELDGRFFNRRTVKARYYDEQQFDMHYFDMPLP